MAVYETVLDNNRQWLRDVVPLLQPFTILLEPTERCNFKCNYCIHSTRGQKGGTYEAEGYEQRNMSWNLFTKIARDIMDFPAPVKHISISGLGEPLVHPQLPEMISHLRSAGFMERISIYTNASLLTPKVSDRLIHAGISEVRVSIQGVDDEAYKDTCGISGVLERIVENVRYFFEHKNNDQILYVKIIDAALRNDSERDIFMNMFGDICDYIFVEHLVSSQRQMHEINFERDKSRGSINLINQSVAYRRICPVPFYYLQIAADGAVTPCGVVAFPKKLAVGNVNNSTLPEIWNGSNHIMALRQRLEHGSDSIEACRGCSQRYTIASPVETIDDHTEEILARLLKLEQQKDETSCPK